jgi:flagellar motor switch protein FliM
MSDQPLVTQQELDILAASMEIAQRQAREGRAAEVALYDFREAAKLSPDQTHELTDRCTVLSKVLSRTMSAYLNTTLQVAFEGLDHPSFDQYLRGLPPNPLLVVFQLDPTTAPAVWQIDLPVALSMLTSMLGGGEQAPPPPLSGLNRYRAGAPRTPFQRDPTDLGPDMAGDVKSPAGDQQDHEHSG